MEELHFLWPLFGGVLIGISAALYLLLNGRIIGISGILATALGLSKASPRMSAIGLLFGLFAGALAASLLIRQPSVEITDSIALLLIGGTFVGFGTQLGSGCTSGHGVCGIARLSPRSILATIIFMSVAAVTVFLMRHVFGG